MTSTISIFIISINTRQPLHSAARTTIAAQLEKKTTAVKENLELDPRTVDLDLDLAIAGLVTTLLYNTEILCVCVSQSNWFGRPN